MLFREQQEPTAGSWWGPRLENLWEEMGGSSLLWEGGAAGTDATSGSPLQNRRRPPTGMDPSQPTCQGCSFKFTQKTTTNNPPNTEFQPKKRPNLTIRPPHLIAWLLLRTLLRGEGATFRLVRKINWNF